jgi:hypothetical protein
MAQLIWVTARKVENNPAADVIWRKIHPGTGTRNDKVNAMAKAPQHVLKWQLRS